MSSAAQTWLAVAVYALIGLTVALIARRRMGGGVNEFFLANRGLGGVVAALSYAATTYSAFMMVGLAGITYKLGVGALGFELTYLGGLVLVVFFRSAILAGRQTIQLSDPRRTAGGPLPKPAGGSGRNPALPCFSHPLWGHPAHGHRLSAGDPFGRHHFDHRRHGGGMRTGGFYGRLLPGCARWPGPMPCRPW